MNPLKLLFSFYGRIGRGPFVGGNVFIWALAAAVIALFVYFTPERPKYVPGAPPDLLVTLLPFLVLLMTWVQFALAAKRYHDVGKSAWFCLLLLVPLVGFIAFLYLLFAEETNATTSMVPA
jgi:uncharacterized membrane protein YhaH (DUF805 family)